MPDFLGLMVLGVAVVVMAVGLLAIPCGIVEWFCDRSNTQGYGKPKK